MVSVLSAQRDRFRAKAMQLEDQLTKACPLGSLSWILVAGFIWGPGYFWGAKGMEYGVMV